MGTFGAITNSIWNMTKGRKLQNKAFSIQNTQLKMAMNQLQTQKNFLEQTEHPRQQAALKQGMFGRGLGKSTIFAQDKDRMTQVQENRISAMNQNLQLLARRRSLLRSQHKAARMKSYIDLGVNTLDGIVALWFGAGGGSDQEAYMGGDSFSGPEGRGGGGPDYYGGGGMYS